MNDYREVYVLGLRALELASERVKMACKGEDMAAAAIETHFGLHAVYDLHETYFRTRKIRKIEPQDDVFVLSGGEVVGALVLARGERTHRLVQFATTGGFGDLPYGMGPFGGGWIWKEHNWDDPDFKSRADWYEAKVRWRHLWTPLDEAHLWFLNQLKAEDS